MNVAGEGAVQGNRAAAPFLVGALVPLSRPGWSEAGRHLLAGLTLAVEQVNRSGRLERPLELIVRDTAGDPQRATSAVDEFDGLGAVAVVGEFHSVVARAAAVRADMIGLPFLCSSAVLDGLIDHPTEYVARLAPAQSHGWPIYADFLIEAGHRRIAVAREPSIYWASGTRILRERVEACGGVVVEIDVRTRTPEELCDEVVKNRTTALLLLTSFPDPSGPIVRAVRRDPRLVGTLIGAPAGQPEFTDWTDLLGGDGDAVPFLRYRHDDLDEHGVLVEAELRDRLGRAPSFVALEGYDAVTVLAEILCAHGGDRSRIAAAWPEVVVSGTRGQIQFSRPPGIDLFQWAWAPVQVVDRDPQPPNRFRTLRDS